MFMSQFLGFYLDGFELLVPLWTSDFHLVMVVLTQGSVEIGLSVSGTSRMMQ
jgi:hypothetical protein